MRDFFFGSVLRTVMTIILSVLLLGAVINACSPQPQYAAPAPVAVAPAPTVIGQPPVIVQQAPVVVHHDGFWSGMMMGHLLSRPAYGPTVVQRTVIAPTVVRPAYVAPVPRAITPSYIPRPSAYTSVNSRGISTTVSRSSISVGRRR